MFIPRNSFSNWPYALGPSVNYVVSVGGGVSPQDDLLNRPYLIKKDNKGGVKNPWFLDNIMFIVYGRPHMWTQK